jgi:hypothetical protein
LELAFSIFREIQEILLRLWRQQALNKNFAPVQKYSRLHKNEVFKVEVVTSWKRLRMILLRLLKIVKLKETGSMTVIELKPN